MLKEAQQSATSQAAASGDDDGWGDIDLDTEDVSSKAVAAAPVQESNAEVEQLKQRLQEQEHKTGANAASQPTCLLVFPQTELAMRGSNGIAKGP